MKKLFMLLAIAGVMVACGDKKEEKAKEQAAAAMQQGMEQAGDAMQKGMQMAGDAMQQGMQMAGEDFEY